MYVCVSVCVRVLVCVCLCVCVCVCVFMCKRAWKCVGEHSIGGCYGDVDVCGMKPSKENILCGSFTLSLHLPFEVITRELTKY